MPENVVFGDVLGRTSGGYGLEDIEVDPLTVSTVIRASGWIVLLGRQGSINQLLQAVGLERVSLLYTETAVVLALVQYVLPLMVLPLMAAIEKIGLRLEEAAVNLIPALLGGGVSLRAINSLQRKNCFHTAFCV